MTDRPRSCRVEHIDVDGVEVPALVQAGHELTDLDRERVAVQVRGARARHRERTPLVALPTRFQIGRALAAFLPDDDARRAAARAVHDLLTGDDAWIRVDLAGPVFQIGDSVVVTWTGADGRVRAGEGVFTGREGAASVDLHSPTRRSGVPGDEHGEVR